MIAHDFVTRRGATFCAACLLPPDLADRWPCMPYGWPGDGRTAAILPAGGNAAGLALAALYGQPTRRST